MGRLGSDVYVLDDEDVIPIPEWTDLISLPGRRPLGYNHTSDCCEVLDADGDGVSCVDPLAVAAVLPIGYTRTFLPAYETLPGAGSLPLFGYTAVAVRESDGQVCVCAVQTDDPTRWSPGSFDDDEVREAVESRLGESGSNRILAQLARCSLEYHCRTAQNIFLGRWEGGIPVSSSCNAACIGCISLQESECCPAPQSRIDFTPSVDEIVDVGLRHLCDAEDAVISFGQGCEGEPLTQGVLMAGAIMKMRTQTRRGTININTNGGLPHAMERVVDSGLDSVRVSLFSPIASEYVAYHRPRGYGLSDVATSVRLCRRSGVSVALNLLVLPGFTDATNRAEALVEMITELDIGQVQLRNLNIDADNLWKMTGLDPGKDPMGIEPFIEYLKKACPRVHIGNYSRAKKG